LQTAEAGQAAINPDVEVNRKGLLVNFLSPAVYCYAEDCETYDEALVILKRVREKKKNDVFARHLLAIRKQRTAESLQQFLQALKLLSKECTFQAVSAEQYREELIREAFINGLNSQGIRQTRLEKDDISSEAKDESAVAAVQKKKNAFSVEALITSDAVVLLGMLNVMKAEKLGASPRFVARSPLARRARTSRLHFSLCCC